MKEFVKEHPFLTFFIATAAINGVVEIVRILKRPPNSWPQPARFTGIPGVFSIQRGCDGATTFALGSPYPSEVTGAETSGSCTPGFYFDPATGHCVPFPTTPPYGGM